MHFHFILFRCRFGYPILTNQTMQNDAIHNQKKKNTLLNCVIVYNDVLNTMWNGHIAKIPLIRIKSLQCENLDSYEDILIFIFYEEKNKWSITYKANNGHLLNMLWAVNTLWRVWFQMDVVWHPWRGVRNFLTFWNLWVEWQIHVLPLHKNSPGGSHGNWSLDPAARTLLDLWKSGWSANSVQGQQLVEGWRIHQLSQSSLPQCLWSEQKMSYSWGVRWWTTQYCWHCSPHHSWVQACWSWKRVNRQLE